MTAKILRKRAWAKLSGKWGTLSLIYFVHSFIASFLGIIGAGPFSLALTDISLHVSRKKEVEFNQLFSGFSRFEDSFVLYLLNMLFIYLWTWLFIIPGIIMSYAYAMDYYILLDNPEMKPNEARKRSIALMKGNKWRLFCLNMSFLGWDILGLMTFGILFYWIEPYRQAAFAEFYEDLIGNTTSEHAEPARPVPPPTPMPTASTIEQLETPAEASADETPVDEAPKDSDERNE